MNFLYRKVKKGSQVGHKIGFPTINLSVVRIGEQLKHGVYLCQIHIKQKKYQGLLYFGSKIPHNHICLEIYVHNFSQNIYGQYIHFKVGKKIREPIIFDNLNDLKKQLQKDLKYLISHVETLQCNVST